MESWSLEDENIINSTSAISSFRRIKNKHNVYRGKDCMKNFCEFLRGHTTEIINLKKIK